MKNRNFRDAEGAVKTAPRNFTTIPPKKGDPATTPGVLFSKTYYEHMKDPYDTAKEIRRKEIKDHQAKLMEGK